MNIYNKIKYKNMTKLTKKNSELIEIFSALAILGQKDLSVWYTISKNIQLIKPYIEKYNEMKDVIVNKFALKDDNNKPLIKNDLYEFGDNLKQASDALETLNNETNEIEFFTFDHSEIKDSKLPAALTLILLDTIIL